MNIIKANSYKDITDNNYLIIFSTYHCPACKVLIKTLNDMNIVIPIYSINIEDNPEMVSTFMIMSVPTGIFFNHNRPMSEIVGSVSPEEIRKCLGESAI